MDIKIWTATVQTEDKETIKCLYFDIGKRRLLIGLASKVWYTTGVTRKIPIFLGRRGGWYFYNLGIKWGKIK